MMPAHIAAISSTLTDLIKLARFDENSPTAQGPLILFS